MKSKIIWISFILLLLLQLWVPASMIWTRETALKEGKIFKFRTAPVDPTDIFRGKYVYLSFAEREIAVKGAHEWNRGEKIFASLLEDSLGYAKVVAISNKKPLTANDDFIEATVGWVTEGLPVRIQIEWPFERYYMEEAKAPAAEREYNTISRDTIRQAYALVRVKNGVAVLQDLMLDDKPITTYLK